MEDARGNVRILSAKLLNRECHPERPQAFLDITFDVPVEWDRQDEYGLRACRRHLRFRLKTDAGLHVECRYDRVNLYLHAAAYRIVLEPILVGPVDDPDHFLHADGLATLAHEARLQGRGWHSDVREIDVFWSYRRNEIATVSNGSYMPIPPVAAVLPPLRDSDMSLEAQFAALDAFCDRYTPVDSVL